MKLGQSFLRESFFLCLIRKNFLGPLLVGSSLALIPVADAAAAAGRNAPAPLSYAGICDPAGDGFFFLPGTHDCLGISGLVRAKPPMSLGANGEDEIVADVLTENGIFGHARDASITRLVFAYTASLGRGFAPTLLLESRRWQVAGGVAPEHGVSGERSNPSFVGDIRLDQPWQQNARGEFGSAVKGGFEFNTNMIAPGDKLWLQAAFEKSPEKSVAADNLKWAFAPASGEDAAGVSPHGYNFGWNTQLPSDCVYTGVTAAAATCDKPSGFSLDGALKHYWAPDLSSTVSGTNLSTDYDPKALARLGGTALDSQETRIGGSPVWMPMNGLDIGTEFMYLHLTQSSQAGQAPNDGGTSPNAEGVPADPAAKNSGSETEGHTQSEGRIRVQRQF